MNVDLRAILHHVWMRRAPISLLLAVWLTLAVSGSALAVAACGVDRAKPVSPRNYGGGKRGRSLGLNVKPVGWTPLTSAAAAKLVHHSPWEPRPQNYTANHTVPSAQELAEWQAQSTMPYASLVNGRFTGTTDEIIQWAAYKWGLPVDVLRAVAALETWWEQSFVGDSGDSYGIFQVRRPYHCFGECAIARDSTPFVADYYGGIIRAYYDGKMTWLNNPDVASQNGAPYTAGDFWGSVGAWRDGRWHTPFNAEYVAKAQANLREKVWLQPRFTGQ